MGEVIDTWKDWEIIFYDYNDKKMSELRRKYNTQDQYELQKLCNYVKQLTDSFSYHIFFPSTTHSTLICIYGPLKNISGRYYIKSCILVHLEQFHCKNYMEFIFIWENI